MLILAIPNICKIKLRMQNNIPPITGEGMQSFVSKLLLLFIFFPNKYNKSDNITVGMVFRNIEINSLSPSFKNSYIIQYIKYCIEKRT